MELCECDQTGVVPERASQHPAPALFHVRSRPSKWRPQAAKARSGHRLLCGLSACRQTRPRPFWYAPKVVCSGYGPIAMRMTTLGRSRAAPACGLPTWWPSQDCLDALIVYWIWPILIKKLENIYTTHNGGSLLHSQSFFKKNTEEKWVVLYSILLITHTSFVHVGEPRSAALCSMCSNMHKLVYDSKSQ